MNRQYNNLILNLKSIELKGLFNDIEIRLNSRKLLNPVIEDFNSRQIVILHDRGRLKIYSNSITSIEYLSEMLFKIQFKFNRNNEIIIKINK